MSILRVLLLLLLIVPGAVLAQSRVPVYVSSTINQNDPLGQRYVAELKEGLRSSQALQLVENSNNWPYIKFTVVSVHVSVGGKRMGTALGYTVLYDDTSIPLSGAYITSGVQVCNQNGILECARDSLSDIDQALSILRKSDQGRRYLNTLTR